MQTREANGLVGGAEDGRRVCVVPFELNCRAGRPFHFEWRAGHAKVAWSA
jgi:hypothetical protein